MPRLRWGLMCAVEVYRNKKKKWGEWIVCFFFSETRTLNLCPSYRGRLPFIPNRFNHSPEPPHLLVPEYNVYMRFFTRSMCLIVFNKYPKCEQLRAISALACSTWQYNGYNDRSIWALCEAWSALETGALLTTARQIARWTGCGTISKVRFIGGLSCIVQSVLYFFCDFEEKCDEFYLRLYFKLMTLRNARYIFRCTMYQLWHKISSQP